jgi:large subunit ribosomal protein L30
MYAVVRVRGVVNISPKITKTFELLNLKRVNNMSIWPETKQSLKMIKIVENHATFGVISEELLQKVILAKGTAKKHEEVDLAKAAKAVVSGKTIKEAGLANCFRMSPPKKGYERKGIKKGFTIGGALGNRKDKMDALVERML